MGSLTMSVPVMIAIFLSAVAATVLCFIFIVPEKKGEKLKGLGKLLHNIVNFKSLMIEKILQAFYIFSTAFVVLQGFCMLFWVQGGLTYGHWMGGWGILTMILGPIVVRLVYEAAMLMILAVKNIIAINNKLRNQNEGEAGADVFATPDLATVKEAFKKEEAPAPATPAAGAFCPVCGAKRDENGKCPNCDQ